MYLHRSSHVVALLVAATAAWPMAAATRQMCQLGTDGSSVQCNRPDSDFASAFAADTPECMMPTHLIVEAGKSRAFPVALPAAPRTLCMRSVGPAGIARYEMSHIMWTCCYDGYVVSNSTGVLHSKHCCAHDEGQDEGCETHNLPLISFSEPLSTSTEVCSDANH